MKKHFFKQSVILVAICSMALQAQCAPSFDQAVADYRAGRYQQALAVFKSYSAAYPNNAMAHYYLAMTHQAVGHIEQAKQEYQAAALYADARLKPMAMAGLAQLNKANTQIAYSPSPSLSPATASSIRPGSGSSSQPKSKVRKIYEFYADW